jgi:hypothetical protein
LSGLERRIVGGHEKTDHTQVASAHDDVAAAVCGALVMAARLAGQEIGHIGAVTLSRSNGWSDGKQSWSTSGIPPHYLKQNQPAEPWRQFVGPDGSISTRGHGPKYWGPV